MAKETLYDFIKRLRGNFVDKYGKVGYSGVQQFEPYGGQCASLARYYVNTLGSGYKSNTYGDGKEYAKIQNGRKVSHPKDGDLVVWTQGAGGYGHVGIYFNGKVFNQNPVKAKLETVETINSRNGLSNQIYIRIPLKQGVVMEEPKTGKYVLNINTALRQGPSTNYKAKKVKNMSAAGKKIATSESPNANAFYKKGSTVTITSIKRNKYGNYWAKTRSGYFLLANDKKMFAKKKK